MPGWRVGLQKVPALVHSRKSTLAWSSNFHSLSDQILDTVEENLSSESMSNCKFASTSLVPEHPLLMRRHKPYNFAWSGTSSNPCDPMTIESPSQQDWATWLLYEWNTVSQNDQSWSKLVQIIEQCTVRIWKCSTIGPQHEWCLAMPEQAKRFTSFTAFDSSLAETICFGFRFRCSSSNEKHEMHWEYIPMRPFSNC